MPSPLIDGVLAQSRARAEGGLAPFPRGGTKVVVVAASELLSGPMSVSERLGLDPQDVLVVAIPGARVQRSDGDVARSVCLAVASLSAPDVIVMAHEGSPYRSPSFSVPGSAPQGESFATITDLVRHSVSQLRAAPWLRGGTNVHGLSVAASGAIDFVISGEAAPSADPSAQRGSLSQGYGSERSSAPMGPMSSQGPAASGPVSFFGTGPVGSLMAAPQALSDAAPWVPPTPSVIAPVGTLRDVPQTPALQRAAAAVAAAAASAAAENARSGHSLGSTLSLGSTSSLDRGVADRESRPELDSIGTPTPMQMPGISEAARARAKPRAAEAPPANPPQSVPPPLPPAPPPVLGPDRAAAPDDPFARAEKILERLRRERRN